MSGWALLLEWKSVVRVTVFWSNWVEQVAVELADNKRSPFLLCT